MNHANQSRLDGCRWPRQRPAPKGVGAAGGPAGAAEYGDRTPTVWHDVLLL